MKWLTTVTKRNNSYTQYNKNITALSLTTAQSRQGRAILVIYFVASQGNGRDGDT